VPAARVIAAALVATLACGCGSKHRFAAAPTPAAAMPPRAEAPRSTSVALRVVAAGRLPAATQLPALALSGSTVLALGGLDAADTSVASVVRVAPGRPHGIGSLPQAVHDAGAATLGRHVYVLGGGTAAGPTDAIVEVGKGVVGHLPVPSSDLEAVRAGDAILVIGGYDGTAPQRSVLAFTPGRPLRRIASLPHPLRYAAASARGAAVIVAGGTDGVHAQSDVVRIAGGRARVIGRLPAPRSHVAGAVLAGTFYAIGGRSQAGRAQRTIWAVDPDTGRVRAAGRLPVALSDAAAVAVGGRILVAGGRTSDGRASDRIWELAPR
jgi:hypothetical protein